MNKIFALAILVICTLNGCQITQFAIFRIGAL